MTKLPGLRIRRFCWVTRPRENMVGVNLVLAESVKFKHGLVFATELLRVGEC